MTRFLPQRLSFTKALSLTLMCLSSLMSVPSFALHAQEQEPLDFVSKSRTKQAEPPTQTEGAQDLPSIDLPTTQAPSITPQEEQELLPSVGPVKKKEMAETAENFDPSELKALDFNSMVERLKLNSNKINQLYGSMPVGFPELQQRQTEKIKLFREQNQRLNQLLPRAAVNEFKKAPGEDPRATKVVYSALKELLDGNNSTYGFDPVMAMEISLLLIKNGDERPEIYFQGFRAAYALQDFGRATTMLERAKGGQNSDAVNRRYQVINNKLDDTKKKWRRELEIRRSDSKQEALPRVQIETTEGIIVAELFENQAAGNVGNFVSLVEKGFYDGLDFHLVRPGRFAQTGDPEGNGTGGPNYNIYCECEGANARHHFSGTLSMATSGPDTGGSQFFITHQPNSVFDGQYTAFGRVIKGMNVVYRLNAVNKTGLRPDDKEASKIIRVTVLRKRNHPYQPKIIPGSESGRGISNSKKSTDALGG